jgi:hypothetical protein
MGEIAEMMLDGILDANGEYTGRNPGYPVYPKGWFKQKQGKFVNSHAAVCKVKCFLKERGIPVGDEQKKIVAEYGRHVNCDRPTFHACSNWPVFKAWVDAKVGYVKPSKRVEQ